MLITIDNYHIFFILPIHVYFIGVFAYYSIGFLTFHNNPYILYLLFIFHTFPLVSITD